MSKVRDYTRAKLDSVIEQKVNSVLIDKDDSLADNLIADTLSLGTSGSDFKLDVASETNYDAEIGITQYSSVAADGSNVRFRRARGTEGVPLVVSSGDSLGSLAFYQHDGTNFELCGAIECINDGAPGSNDAPAKLTFWTCPDGSNTAAQRLVINNTGAVGVGQGIPQAMLEVGSTKNALSDTGIQQNYHLLLRADDNDDEGVGLAFARSTGRSQLGAAIIFERTGTNSKGDLLFYTKQSTGDGTDPTKSLTIGDDGQVTVEERVSIGATTASSRLTIKQSAETNAGGIRLIESDDDNDIWAIYRSETNLNFYRATDGASFSQIGYLSPASAAGLIDFTGQHRSSLAVGALEDYADKVGMIVVASGQYSPLSDSDAVNINESLPTVQLASTRGDKRVFGVISDSEEASNPERHYSAGCFTSAYEKREGDHRLIINSLGEGAIWVSDINDNLENGDYITSCEISGYGMKQDDDLLHNYTVAKITQDCNFDLSSSGYECKEIEFSGSTHKVAFVGCTYHCG